MPKTVSANLRRCLISRKILAGMLCFCLFCAAFFGVCFSSDSDSYAKSLDEQGLRSNIYDIYSRKIEDENASDLQDLIDTSFCNDPLNGTNQTYIISIIQNPEISADFTKYIGCLSYALDQAVNSEEGIFPTSLQKSVSVLNKCADYSRGEDTKLSELVSPEVYDTALYHTIGEKGIMSYIYGLYMIDTCRLSELESSREEIVNSLLSMQCSDGGFTLAGSEGDIDVTAMCLQSLAPTYLAVKNRDDMILSQGTGEALEGAINDALVFLSTKQLSSGDYESFGSATSESTSQVILSLCSLNLSSVSNDDFIKENSSLMDGLLIYKTEDGGFSHTAKMPVNDMASSQALQALTSIYFTEFDDSVTTVTLASEIGKKSLDPEFFRHLIPVVFAIIMLTAGLLLTIKRKKIIHLISGIIVAALFAGVFYGLDIRSKSSFENAKSNVILSEDNEKAISVTFRISAATIDSGEIYPETVLYVAKDSTVFEILKEVCRTENIQLDYEKSSAYGLAYIKGINSIYEYDHGDLSGWMYRVNGEMPNIGVGYYKVEEGDIVEILYSTNIGRDLND